MPTRTILSPNIRTMLEGIGSKLEGGEHLGSEVAEAVNLLGRLDPRELAPAEREIVEAGALHRWRSEPSLIANLFTRKVSEADQLQSVAQLEYLFLFHRDGRMREAALRKITGPLPNPFIFAAVAWRLNDWAEPVRRAAVECAARSFPATAARVVAEAALSLQTRRATWGRWDQESKILDAAFERRDVASCLAALIGTRVTGPMASLLRQALRNGSMDEHLQLLSADAAQPAVRAAAIQSLIRGYAEWPSGWRWRWIDKSMGVRRRETAFERRPLVVRSDAARAIRLGLDDRAAAVRIAAMSGLIQEQATLEDARSLALPMLEDRSAAVRERAEFVINRADELER